MVARILCRGADWRFCNGPVVPPINQTRPSSPGPQSRNFNQTLCLQTLLSFLIFSLYAGGMCWDLWTPRGGISIPLLIKFLSSDIGSRCIPVVVPLLTRFVLAFALNVAAFVCFVIYLLSCLIKRHDEGGYDDWRLAEVAYPLVRRLANPIPARDLPQPVRSFWDRILRLNCLRSSKMHNKISSSTVLTGSAATQSHGLLTGKPARRNLLERLKTLLVQSAVFVILSIKSGTSPPDGSLSSRAHSAQLLRLPRSLESTRYLRKRAMWSTRRG